jgi:hypothetical protein
MKTFSWLAGSITIGYVLPKCYVNRFRAPDPPAVNQNSFLVL